MNKEKLIDWIEKKQFDLGKIADDEKSGEHAVKTALGGFSVLQGLKEEINEGYFD